MLVIIFVCTLNTGEATLTNGIISMRVQSARGGGWATRLQLLATLTLALGAVHILRKHILGSLNTLGSVVSVW